MALNCTNETKVARNEEKNLTLKSVVWLSVRKLCDNKLQSLRECFNSLVWMKQLENKQPRIRHIWGRVENQYE